MLSRTTGSCWALRLNAGQLQGRGTLLAVICCQKKPLQLWEIVCAPCWEHSVSDTRGLGLGTRGDDAAGPHGSARLARPRRLFVLV